MVFPRSSFYLFYNLWSDLAGCSHCLTSRCKWDSQAFAWTGCLPGWTRAKSLRSLLRPQSYRALVLCRIVISLHMQAEGPSLCPSTPSSPTQGRAVQEWDPRWPSRLALRTWYLQWAGLWGQGSLLVLWKTQLCTAKWKQRFSALRSCNGKAQRETGCGDFTRSYGSHPLTHSEAVMVNELDMKDWPSFKLTKTSRVLPRDKEETWAAMEQPGKAHTCSTGTCTYSLCSTGSVLRGEMEACAYSYLGISLVSSVVSLVYLTKSCPSREYPFSILQSRKYSQKFEIK